MLRHLQRMGKRAGAGGWNPGLMTDEDVLCLYQFESGALGIDSSENAQTLSTRGTVNEDTAIYKVGLCSAEGIGGYNFFYRNNADLHNDFPGKSGGSGNKTFSFCFWAYCDTAFNSPYLPDKGDSFRVRTPYGKFGLYIYDPDSNLFQHDSSLSADNWYHVRVMWDGNNGPNFSYRFSIWDGTTGAVLGDDLVGTSSIVLNAATDALRLLAYSENWHVDEFVMFKRAVSLEDFNKIARGLYV